MAPKSSQATRRAAARARTTPTTDEAPAWADASWRTKTLAAASAEEAAWRQMPYWALNDEAYERIAEKLRKGSSGEWSYMNACPHSGNTAAKQMCTCPRMLNVAHPTWGVCRVVDGEARPVFKKSDMTLTLPLGSAAMVRDHGGTMLQALAGVAPAMLEASRPACAFVEEMLRSEQTRAAATAVFYEAGADAVPRVSLAKRLEHGIEPSAGEFIVFWHHEGKQFQFMEGPDMESVFEQEKRRFASCGLAEHTGRPWYRQAQVGPYKLAVRYYLFGAEPHENEPVGATLSKTFLCATLVYARCTRLDLASSPIKKRLLQAVSISSHYQGLPVNAETCSSCGASDTYDVAHYKMPFDYTDCTVLRTGEEPDPRYLLLLFKRDNVAVRCPVVRVEPCRVGETSQEYAAEATECIPPKWRLRNAPPAKKLVALDTSVYKRIGGPGYACVRPQLRVAASPTCRRNVCGACKHVCALVHRAPPVAPAPPSGSDNQNEADREVERANEEAREHKLLMKKAAVQPSLTIPTAAADEAAGPGAPAETTLSKNASRRREKKAKQQRAEQRRTEEKQQRADEEFRKVLKAVEPLRLETGTVVREDLESLESLKALGALLQKEEKRAKAKPRRAPTQAETELAHALLGAGQLRGRMRQEVEAFINGYPGITPDAGAFAERLVESLLVGEALGPHDLRAAAEVYGDFANAFAGHSWSEPRLARAGRMAILRAAAEA